MAKKAKKAKAKKKAVKRVAPENKPLSPKEQLFVNAYATNGNNGKEACITAGYSERSAKEQASRMLTRANIRKALEKVQEKTAKKMEITREVLANELAKIAFSNMGDFVKWSKKGIILTESDKLTKDQKGIIEEIKETTTFGGTTVSFKLLPKTRAIEQLAKLLGLNKPVLIDLGLDDVAPIGAIAISILPAGKKPDIPEE